MLAGAGMDCRRSIGSSCVLQMRRCGDLRSHVELVAAQSQEKRTIFGANTTCRGIKACGLYFFQPYTGGSLISPVIIGTRLQNGQAQCNKD